MQYGETRGELFGIFHVALEPCQGEFGVGDGVQSGLKSAEDGGDRGRLGPRGRRVHFSVHHLAGELCADRTRPQRGVGHDLPGFRAKALLIIGDLAQQRFHLGMLVGIHLTQVGQLELQSGEVVANLGDDGIGGDRNRGQSLIVLGHEMRPDGGSTRPRARFVERRGVVCRLQVGGPLLGSRHLVRERRAPRPGPELEQGLLGPAQLVPGDADLLFDECSRGGGLRAVDLRIEVGQLLCRHRVAKPEFTKEVADVAHQARTCSATIMGEPRSRHRGRA